MTGLEPRIFGVWSDRSTIWARTTAPASILCRLIVCISSLFVFGARLRSKVWASERHSLSIIHHRKLGNVKMLQLLLSLSSYHSVFNKNAFSWGAAIAQWICLRLPSCRHGFESQSHYQCFYQFIFWIVSFGKDENISTKEIGIWNFLKKFLFSCQCYREAFLEEI